jgi:hypothetical protein
VRRCGLMPVSRAIAPANAAVARCDVAAETALAPGL